MEEQKTCDILRALSLHPSIETKKPPIQILDRRLKIIRQRPTLPPGDPSSTIGAGGLNGSVRNGKRCDPSAMVTGKIQ